MPQVILFWFAAVAIVGLVETVLYYGSPQLLARFAFLPAGASRDVPVSRALLDGRQQEAGYRAAARAAFSLDLLNLSTHIDGDESVGRWEGDQGWLRARIKWFGWNRSLGVAQLRAHVRGERVHLAAKVYPMPVSMLLMIPLIAFMAVDPFGESQPLFFIPIVIAVLAINWYMSVRRLRGDIEAALMRIGADIENPPR